jgi:bifunctional DNase/RNase
MSRAWVPVVVALLLVTGCGRLKAKPRARNADGTCAPMAHTPGIAQAPVGYSEVRVTKMTPQGSQVRLEVSSKSGQVVPLFIGGTEGTSLRLRLNNEAPTRPLTHDLLDGVLCELDAELVQAQVDELRDDVFIGTLVLRQQGRLVKLDARPSDAIALAVGAKAPIYMAKRVLDEAAVTASP